MIPAIWSFILQSFTLCQDMTYHFRVFFTVDLQLSCLDLTSSRGDATRPQHVMYTQDKKRAIYKELKGQILSWLFSQCVCNDG